MFGELYYREQNQYNNDGRKGKEEDRFIFWGVGGKKNINSLTYFMLFNMKRENLP